MKTLVVYYSRTGNSKKVAEAIAKELNAEIEEIVDTKNRAGFFGFLSAGWDAMLKKTTIINKTINDPSAYDLVIIGGPIWGFLVPSPAVRTYLLQTKGQIKKIAFFCTKSGSPGKSTFNDMAKTCGIEPVALLETTDDEIKNGTYIKKVKEFTNAL